MKTRTVRSLAVAIAGLAALLNAPAATAATYYWDSDGTTAGFGSTAGTWGTSAFWTLTSGGGSPHAGVSGTASGDTVNFGDATLNYASAAVGVAAGGVSVGNISFGDGQSTALTLGDTANAITLDAAATITLSRATTTHMINAILAGAGTSLTKAGHATSVLALGGPNTYSGQTLITGGDLLLNRTDAIANSSSVSVASGTTLQLNAAGTYATAGTISIVGTGVAGLANPGALFFGSAGLTTATLNAPLTLGGTTRFSSYGVTMNQTLGGAITGSGPLTINSRGGGNTHTAVWMLKAASTYSGSTDFINNDGLKDLTVMLGVANALPTSTSLNLRGNTGMSGSIYTTLDLNGFPQTLAGLTDTGSSSGSGTGTFGKRVINSSGTLATLTINNPGAVTYGTTGTRVLAGTIGGLTAAGVAAHNLALTKTGAGDLTLSGSNTYTGNTTINNGRIFVSTTTGVPSGSAIFQSGTGQFFVSATGLTLDNNFTISTTGYVEGGDATCVDGAIRSDQNNTFSGTITLSGDSRIGSYIGTASGTSQNTISGKLTGGFAVSFYGLNGNNSVAQTYILSNTANDYTGDTQIDNHDYQSVRTGASTTLKLGASHVIPDGASAGRVFFNGADANHLTVFDLNGFSDTINGLSVGGGAAGAKITNSGAGASVLTVGANDTMSSFSGVITDSGGGKTLALTKTGGGTLTLSGATTYTGATTVNGGSLALGAHNVLPDATAVSIGNATLHAATYTDTLGTLDVAGSAGINLGTGAALAFADSRAIDWTGGTLYLTGTFVSGSSLRFGSTSGGLTSAQLTTISGSGFTSCALDANGYLVETTPPTLAGSAIVDNELGGPIRANNLVTFTVTFSEDMDAGTLAAADFGNAGTATLTIGAVAEVTPGVFTVEVTPTTPGTLRLQVNAGAELRDVAGNLLDTASAILDNTTITIVGTGYWDLDGAGAGAGGATPAGIWNATNPYWNDASDGTGATAPWSAGQTAIFAAAADATGTYTVTVDGTPDVGGLTFEEGTVTLSGGTALRLVVANSTAHVGAGLSATIWTSISQDALPRSLTKSGAGTLVISGANAYTGDTTVNAGTLKYGADDVIATGAVNVNGATAVLDLTGYSDTVGAVTLSGGGTLTGGTLTSTGTFEMQNGSASTVLAGPGIALNKTTAGTVTLSAENIYSGNTTIAAGTLRVSNGAGSATGEGAVTVKSTATLEGTGRIRGTATVEAGGRLSPGTSGLGTLRTHTLHLQADSVLVWDIDPEGADDAIDVESALTLPAHLMLNINLLRSGEVYGTVLFNLPASYTGPEFVSLAVTGVTGNLAAVRRGTQIVLERVARGAVFSVK